MKKIIFVINNLQTGGVQISLLNLLKEIHNDYDVTVLSFYYKDEYRNLIPDNVHLISVNSLFRYFGISQGELRGKPLQYATRAFLATSARLFGRSFTIKLMSLFQKTIGTYDCAINSQKGNALLGKLKDKLDLYEYPLNVARQNNQSFREPEPYPPQKRKLEQILIQQGEEKLIKELMCPHLTKHLIYARTPSWVKHMYQKIRGKS